MLPMQFSHSNGFPSECYQELFDALNPEFNIKYISMIAHRGLPLSENWQSMMDELVDAIEANWQEPIIGVGHSLGGVLMYMASCIRPELFRQVILLDAPIPGVLRSWFLLFLKRTQLLRMLFPVDRAKKRRFVFADRQEALEYFKHKKLFKQFTAKSLGLYVKYGLVECEGGVTLRFNREIETQIFATPPHHLPSINKDQKVKVPSSLIYSMHSHLVKPFELRVMKRLGFQLIPFAQGTHLFPFEFPIETAELIKKTIVLR